MTKKYWKKTKGKDVWVNLDNFNTIRLIIIGNPEYAQSMGLCGKVNDYAIELNNGFRTQYHRNTFRKKSDALKIIKLYMRNH